MKNNTKEAEAEVVFYAVVSRQTNQLPAVLYIKLCYPHRGHPRSYRIHQEPLQALFLLAETVRVCQKGAPHQLCKSASTGTVFAPLGSRRVVRVIDGWVDRSPAATHCILITEIAL